MWISPAKLVDCHKHGRIKQGKTGDSAGKGWTTGPSISL
jgi:hypothetical protein